MNESDGNSLFQADGAWIFGPLCEWNWAGVMYGKEGGGMSATIETTNELDPLKGLTRLLTLVGIERKGGENH